MRLAYKCGMFSAVHPLLKPVLVAAAAVTIAFWLGAFLERSLSPRSPVPVCPYQLQKIARRRGAGVTEYAP